MRSDLIDSFAWKMTYAKIIFGEEVVEDIRRMMPADVFLSLLTSIHLDFEHPFTHGAGRPRKICDRDIFERHELDVGPEWLQDVRLSFRGYERVPEGFHLPIPVSGGLDLDFTLKMRHEAPS